MSIQSSNLLLSTLDQIRSLDFAVKTHQLTLSMIPEGISPNVDALQPIAIDIGKLSSSLTRICSSVTTIENRALKRKVEILSRDLDFVRTMIDQQMENVVQAERERIAKEVHSLTCRAAPCTPGLSGVEYAPRGVPSSISDACGSHAARPPFASISATRSSSVSGSAQAPSVQAPSARGPSQAPTERETLMLGLLSNPKELFCYDMHPKIPFLKGFPYIRECHCIDGFRREEMRTGIPNCRQVAEDALVRMIQEKFPLRTHPEIFLCSIASAYCMQESVIHTKLRQLGYRVNWLLVDPIYATPQGEHILADFARLTKCIDGGEGATQINWLPSIDSLSEEGLKHLPRKPDAFFAVDLGMLGERDWLSYHGKLNPMERRLQSLAYPHIYLYADKRVLEDVSPTDLLTDQTHGHIIRPVVTIEYTHSSGIERRNAIGPLAWDKRNYRDHADEERTKAPLSGETSHTLSSALPRPSRQDPLQDEKAEARPREVSHRHQLESSPFDRLPKPRSSSAAAAPPLDRGKATFRSSSFSSTRLPTREEDISEHVSHPVFDYLSTFRAEHARAHATILALNFPVPQKKAEMLRLVAQISGTALELMQDAANTELHQDIYHSTRASLIKIVEQCQKSCDTKTSEKIRLSALEGLTYIEWAVQAHELCDKARLKGCSPSLLREFEDLIVRYKADINLRGATAAGGTILHYLAVTGRPLEFVPLLAKHGADFTLAELDGLDNTPLLWAIANASMRMAMEFLKYGPQKPFASDYLNQKGQGNTALHLAVGKGQEVGRELNGQIARMLVELGANINAQNDQDGNTALHLACLRRDPDMILFLLQNGASKTLLNHAGQTPGDLLKTRYEAACAILEHTSPFSLDPGLFAANLIRAQEAYRQTLPPTAARLDIGAARTSHRISLSS